MSACPLILIGGGELTLTRLHRKGSDPYDSCRCIIFNDSLCYICYSTNHSCCSFNKNEQQKMIILHPEKV